MFVIFFGIVGVIIGYLVLGMVVSVLFICGIIVFFGVVVNDSLIMVDFVNCVCKEGLLLIDVVISVGM